MTSPGGVITGDDILLDSWLDLTTADEDSCHYVSCGSVAVYGMVHTIQCEHLASPLPFCLEHHDVFQQSIDGKAEGMYFIYCCDCRHNGAFIRWEPWKK
jgi:hypothetical protein